MRLRSPFGAPPFHDRHEAGQRLAGALARLAPEQPLVVGLPRGGVVVASHVAEALGAPLDVVMVRKLGVPFQPQLAMGAIGEDGVVLVDRQLAALCGLEDPGLDALVARERAALESLSQRLRGIAAPLSPAGLTVVLVDDGIATGSTAHAAARVLRERGAARIVLAVPIGPPDVRDRFAGAVDEVVCLETPVGFRAVGEAYADFEQTSDEEVVELLRRGRQRALPDP